MATIHTERPSRSSHPDSLSGRPKHVIHAQGRWIINTGTIETHGQRLYYESHGKGKPLLLVAGLGADITAWQLQIAPLSAHFQVIAFDNRDSGRSSRATDSYGIADMATDTAGLLDALGFNKTHVLGTSMGGAIAQELAINHPNRLDKLILSSTMPQFARFAAFPIQVWTWLRERDPENLVFPIEVISWCMTHEFLKDSAAVEEMSEQIRHPPYPVPPEAFRRQTEALCAFDALDRLTEIHATTLVLVGAEDILTPPWAARELATHIASARLQVLDGGAHCPYWEIADRFNQAVIDFLTAG
jgi:3-oxoadipate enol-lactonase